MSIRNDINIAFLGNQVDELKKQIKRLMEALHRECPEKYPDNCEICKGANTGVCGNENIVDGKVTCDYCSIKLLDMKL